MLKGLTNIINSFKIVLGDTDGRFKRKYYL